MRVVGRNANGMVIRSNAPCKKSCLIVPLFPVLVHIEISAFSRPQKGVTTNETIRNGARAYVCAFNFDHRGEYANRRQDSGTAAPNSEHIKREHSKLAA